MIINKLVEEIKQQYLDITEIECLTNILEKGEMHTPSILKKGEQGVYVFYKEDICFKVGPKSKARWNSHHYNLDTSTPSTMPKSIIKNLASFKLLYNNSKNTEIDNFRPDNIKKQVRNNISRIEFKIDSSESKFSLGLLESLVQFHFRPIYESTASFSNRINFK